MVKNIFPRLVLIYKMIRLSYIFIVSPFSIARLRGLGPIKVLFFVLVTAHGQYRADRSKDYKGSSWC